MKNCPVGFTCPSIDATIRDAESARNYIDQASGILDGLLGRNGQLEELRDQNSELRSWGERLADELEDMIDNFKESELHVDDLLIEIEELKARIIYFEEKYE